MPIPAHLRGSICANCNHWREEHYNQDGSWRGEKLKCVEYLGTTPNADELKTRDKHLEKLAQ